MAVIYRVANWCLGEKLEPVETEFLEKVGIQVECHSLVYHPPQQPFSPV